MGVYQIKHHYDVGDRGVFIKFLDLSKSEEVKNIAVYLQFKAEEILDESVTLDNITIVQFLTLLGAQILDNEPKEFYEIDMFYDRVDRCIGRWHEYRLYDEKYGKQATEYLKEKAKGKILAGNVI